jgi:hypothetical protein
MSNTHLKTAHDYGVQKALEAIGYTSTDEVIKEAQALGLVQASKTAAALANPLDALFKTLGK